MRWLGQTCAVLAIALALPASAGEPWQEIWDFDSIAAPAASITSNYQVDKEVSTTIERMFERWNARDMEGYLDYCWKSPRLVIVGNGTLFTGWQEVHDKYTREYSNRELMGHSVIARVQVRLLSPDTAFTVVYWSCAFPKAIVVGMDTNYLQRFGDGWKVTMSHSTEGEM